MRGRWCLTPAGGAPGFAVFADPIQQGAFKPDVVSQALRFDPFMAENLLPFGEKLLVKAGLLYEIPGRFGRLGRGVGHGYHGEGLY